MFVLVDVAPLRFTGGPARNNEYLLSPYAFDGGRRLLVRAVPRLDAEPERKISRGFYGRSEDGLTFALDDEAILAPGPYDVDLGGVEDPTVVQDGGALHVFYSGWNPEAKRSTMLRAVGSNGSSLDKKGAVLPASAGQAKEPTLARHRDGWQMFYEAERGDHSLNASASAASLQGPWTIGPDVLYPRAGSFDAWHLSPFALLPERDGSFVLFYNGATRDGRWQIGWCLLDEDCATIVKRCNEPLIGASRNQPNQRELAFGASLVATNAGLFIYYSIGDTDPARACIQRSFV